MGRDRPMTRLLREHPAIDAELDAGRAAGRDPLERAPRGGRGVQPLAGRGVVVAGADRARLLQGRRPELARARLPRPHRRDLAPGAAVRLMARPVGGDGPRAVSGAWRPERDRDDQQHDEHRDRPGRAPRSRAVEPSACAANPHPQTGPGRSPSSIDAAIPLRCCGQRRDRRRAAAGAARSARPGRPARRTAGLPPARRAASASSFAALPRIRQPPIAAHPAANSTVIIVDPPAGRKVVWTRHSGTSACESSTREPSSSGSDRSSVA